MAAEVIGLVKGLDPSKKPDALNPALERLGVLLFNRLHKKTAHENGVMPKLVALLKNPDADVIGNSLEALAHFAQNNDDVGPELEALTHNLYLPLAQSHPSLDVRSKAFELISQFVIARVWEGDNDHIHCLLDMIIQSAKTGDVSLVRSALGLATRTMRNSIFTSEMFDAAGLNQVLITHLTNKGNPHLVMAIILELTSLKRKDLTSKVDLALLKSWTNLENVHLALIACCALVVKDGSSKNTDIYRNGIDKAVKMFKARTNTYEPMIEYICEKLFYLTQGPKNGNHSFNNGSPDSLYGVLQEMVETSPVPQYVEAGVLTMSVMFRQPEVVEHAILSPFSAKLLALYEAGHADEYTTLRWFYKLCVHRNAKSLLPVERIETLFSPLMAGKPGTPSAIMSILILAALVDSDKTRAFPYGEAAINTIKFICFLIKSSLSRDNKNRDNRWRFDVVMAGIANLAINERNQSILGEAGLIPLLIDTLHAKETDEWLYLDTKTYLKDSKKYALQALMNLAFHRENVPRYSAPSPTTSRTPKEDIQGLLVKAKQRLASLHEKPPAKAAEGEDDEVAETEQTIKALEGVLFILNQREAPPAPPASEKAKEGALPAEAAKSAEKKPEGHIMISYQWGAQPTVKKLAQKLKEHGHKVWLDLEQMQGSTLEAMANAVEQASVVLICVSQKYKDSPNCRLEGEYAANLRKRVVFLKMQNYQPDGWLGIMLGAKLWYNFFEEHLFDENFGAIHALLSGSSAPLPAPEHSAPSQPSEPAPRAPPPPPVSTDHACRSWKNEDIAKWLTKTGLPDVILSLFQEHHINAIALHQLARLASSDMVSFSSFCKDIGLKKVGDVLVLADALQQLLRA